MFRIRIRVRDILKSNIAPSGGLFDFAATFWKFKKTDVVDRSAEILSELPDVCLHNFRHDTVQHPHIGKHSRKRTDGDFSSHERGKKHIKDSKISKYRNNVHGKLE